MREDRERYVKYWCYEDMVAEGVPFVRTVFADLYHVEVLFFGLGFELRRKCLNAQLFSHPALPDCERSPREP